MNENEKKLSDYIDSLNKEKKPREHENMTEAPEMEELFKTVRLVRSLKEPSLPEDEYGEKLAEAAGNRLLYIKNSRKKRKKWLLTIASAAAVALIIILNLTLPFGRNNMTYAMEKAFEEVKAYHGFLEIVEINGAGKSIMQSKMEVWADREGRYYVKGLDGPQKNLITVNNGQNKWQIQPEQKEVNIFSAFPDSYSFTFEIGKEIDDVKNALKTKIIGDGTISGRSATIMEVTPQGGSPYKIWVDKDTKMPLQKQTSMENSIQYKMYYTSIGFTNSIPKKLLSYTLPEGFKEIDTNSQQIVGSLEDAKKITGFTPKVPKNIPASFTQDNITVASDSKVVKILYISMDNKNKVEILQKKSSSEFKPVSTAVIGRINNSAAEIQSPVQNEVGILQGIDSYAGSTDINSVRWQLNGFEYAVVGNSSLEELKLFIKDLTNGIVDLPSSKRGNLAKPEVKVPVDLKIEQAEQKNADRGHSPWKLDPVFTSQVFVSLKISPEGIQGDYPIKYEELNVLKNTGIDAVVEVGGKNTPIRKVYLKKLIRQDSTGIWTVVGYDPT
ncbi:LolA family protein [Clostridium sp. HV4-5-A1G]|uniref:LolA family protein n=1 Tax=Clostridium sp. HV4-5-A1G TaxID=2004595 RepID=UPI00123A7E71|nr:sigma-E factor regulatory protein RseB domain-containing protein [Clostridium sp. HV4-5-A1G]KAA8674767.1 hypothetical protein F3O63_06585 [Clostridium sp. HV4-5-A1G]CAB1241170.1 MucB_RseB domain-containing protein [Clostridiaceae bacterium BL-3]